VPTFDKLNGEARTALAGVTDAQIRNLDADLEGENVIFSMPRYEVLPLLASIMSFIIGATDYVFSLLGVSVPGLYGPSADEQ